MSDNQQYTKAFLTDSGLTKKSQKPTITFTVGTLTVVGTNNVA